MAAGRQCKKRVQIWCPDPLTVGFTWLPDGGYPPGVEGSSYRGDRGFLGGAHMSEWRWGLLERWWNLREDCGVLQLLD